MAEFPVDYGNPPHTPDRRQMIWRIPAALALLGIAIVTYEATANLENTALLATLALMFLWTSVPQGKTS